MTEIQALGEKLGKGQVIHLSMILDRAHDYDKDFVSAIIEPYGATEEDLAIIRKHIKSRVRHRKVKIVNRNRVFRKKPAENPVKVCKHAEATGTMAEMLRNLYAN